MTKRMLIDASHAEETRVVVLDGNRLEAFDLEAATRKPLKGNIYLAKVVRVEPSLQAAFVEYGGNRHGFLAFGEIHPDYYQIPIADRQRLLEMQAAEAREEEEGEDLQPESAMDRAAGAGDEEEERGAGRHEGFDAAAGDDAAGDTSAVDDASNDEGDAPPPGATAQPMTMAVDRRYGPAGEEGAEPDPEVGEAAQGSGPGEGPSGSAAEEPPPAIASAAPTEAEADAPAAVEPDVAPLLPEQAAAASPLEAPTPETEDAAAEEGDTLPSAAAAEDETPGTEADTGADTLLGAGAEGNGLDHAVPEEAEARGQRRARGRDEHRGRGRRRAEHPAEEAEGGPEGGEELPPPETIGGDGAEGADEDGSGRERRIPPRFLRHYKIQEVIKRRQIMLVQVVKEERGTKGAALTSYISLAGRFSVLMPNSPRGGGVSRKITSATDRKRLREVIDELGLPDGMSLIVRTAGAQRPKPEIKRDCEYLLRLWDNIRERTLASAAPALIYEEADLIKRAIRDTFSRDVEEILVDGEDAYREAREFMRMLMPQHVRKIQLSREGGLFARQQVEQQLDAMHSPTVPLRSGGYLVINQTEALVAIDVNSGRSTRERHIEDTALRTNLEAADEVARQLRLRDLAGLIVIDFIDMESSRHDGMVERRLKEALKHDRARIQVGRISHFGLLEMSRQRLRPSIAETSFVTCPHCSGRGQVRSLESSALAVLRAIEEEGAKRRAAEICVHVCPAVALYLLNRKRDGLAQIEARFGMVVVFEPDESLNGPAHRIERLRAADPSTARQVSGPPAALRMDYAPEPDAEEAETAEEEGEEEEAASAEEADSDLVQARPGESQGEAEARADAESNRRRRRRRRRRGGEPRPGAATPDQAATGEGEEESAGEGFEEEAEAGATRATPREESREAPRAEDRATAQAGDEVEAEAGAPAREEGADAGRGGPRRRRGRRPPGSRGEAAGGAPSDQPAAHAAPSPAPVPRYMGPTPADPFAGHVDDILAAMEAAEAAAEEAERTARAAPFAAPRPPVTTVAPPEEAEQPAYLADTPAAAAPAGSAPTAEEPPAAVVAEETVTEETVAEAPASPSPEMPAAEPPAAPAPNGAAAEPALPEEPVAAPPVQPKLLDEVAADTPRRAGWWRR